MSNWRESKHSEEKAIESIIRAAMLEASEKIEKAGYSFPRGVSIGVTSFVDVAGKITNKVSCISVDLDE